MSIPHLIDLPIDKILSELQYNWYVSYKFDGSSITFGIDDNGFFTKWKNSEKRYNVDDWPDLAWTNSFKFAHITLEAFLNEMKDFTKNDCKNLLFEAEIIDGKCHNVIEYNISYQPFDIDGFIVITKCPELIYTKFIEIYRVNEWRQYFSTTISIWKSQTGCDLYKENTTKIFKVFFNNRMYIPSRHTMFSNWLETIEETTNLTYETILLLKFNKTQPSNISNDLWKNKEHLKNLRNGLINEFHYKLLNESQTLIKYCGEELLYDTHMHVTTHHHEGIVVDTKSSKFKLVDQNFKKANKFIHRVQYYLWGGSRPYKPSFFERTKTWPKEKRLQRLEYLLNKYLKYRDQISFRYTNGRIIKYENELHMKTLLLFAEIRNKIENGW